MTTFELTNESEREGLRQFKESAKRDWNSLRSLTNRSYNSIPRSVKVGVLICTVSAVSAFGGALVYKGIADKERANEKIWVDYHVSATEGKERPYDWKGYVTRTELEHLQNTRGVHFNSE